MIAERTGDGRWGPFRFTCGEKPGQWRPVASLVCTTPSGPSDPFAWVAKVEPFVVKSNEQFLSKGPPPLRSRAYAKEYDEVETLGALGAMRTPAQQALVDFFQAQSRRDVLPIVPRVRAWARPRRGGAGAPLRQVRLLERRRVDQLLGEQGALEQRRPLTAIRLGDADRNRRTEGDATWTPAVATPPYGDVASGYNCATASFMEAAELYFGRKRTLFTLLDPAGMTREYLLFRDVVDDTIDARVYQGIRFRTADEVGAKLGHRVARWVDRDALQRARH